MTPEEQENADLLAALNLVEKYYPNVVIVYADNKQHGYVRSRVGHITITLGAVACAQHDMIRSVIVNQQ